jgi:hypothetical protein
MWDLQMIYQFSLELLDSFARVFSKASRRKTELESASEPRRVYLLTISVPFCRICFSHLSYLGRLEM